MHYWVDIISKIYLSENSRIRVHLGDTVLCNFIHKSKEWLPSSSPSQYQAPPRHHTHKLMYN